MSSWKNKLEFLVLKVMLLLHIPWLIILNILRYFLQELFISHEKPCMEQLRRLVTNIPWRLLTV